MSRVSYQAILDGAPAGHARYVPVQEDAVSTRRKQATRKLRVRVSEPQRSWLEEVAGVSGRGVDEGAVVRALLDVGMSLEIDWPMVSGGAALRRSVREAIRVRRDGTEPEGA